MFEPEELMVRIVDLEEQLKASEMAPPAAEQLIACLEGEIAKRDARISELERAEKNDAIAYKAVLERQDELRAELAAIKAKSVMPDVNLAAKALCSRHAAICGVDEDDQWKEYGQDFIADAETVLANSRLCAATVLEVNAHCAVIPEPYGWVAAGSFYTDRESAICAAEKTPCIDVYSRPQMNALENRSLQRQELAEELARQLNASCAEIRNMRNLYAAPVSEAKAQSPADQLKSASVGDVVSAGGLNFHIRAIDTAQGVVMPDERSAFEKWGETLFFSACFERHGSDEYAGRGLQGAWLGWQARAALSAAPIQQLSVPNGSAMARTLADRSADACNVNREDNWAIYGQGYIDDVTAMLAAAPAAPAADAGIVDMYRHLQKVTPYRFKKIQDASITDGGDVMYFHKDRFDAALLADMAAHCAAKGVV